MSYKVLTLEVTCDTCKTASVVLPMEEVEAYDGNMGPALEARGWQQPMMAGGPFQHYCPDHHIGDALKKPAPKITLEVVHLDPTKKPERVTRPLPEGLVEKVREWLGADGLDFFTKCLKDHGTVSPCYPEEMSVPGRPIPHPVHLREGMSVRNFMRDTGLCEGWDAHDFDNNWAEVVQLAINTGETP